MGHALDCGQVITCPTWKPLTRTFPPQANLEWPIALLSQICVFGSFRQNGAWPPRVLGGQESYFKNWFNGKGKQHRSHVTFLFLLPVRTQATASISNFQSSVKCVSSIWAGRGYCCVFTAWISRRLSSVSKCLCLILFPVGISVMAFTFPSSKPTYTTSLAVVWLHLVVTFVDYISIVMQPELRCDFFAASFSTLTPPHTENQHQRMRGHRPRPKCSPWNCEGQTTPERKRKVETIVQFSKGWIRFRWGSSEFTASWCAKLSQAWNLLFCWRI